MPELPEVETIRRGLQTQIVGKTISKITIKKPNLVKQSGQSFRKELIGKQFGKVDRIGKLLIFMILDEKEKTEKSPKVLVPQVIRRGKPRTLTPFTQGVDIKKYLLIHLKMTGQLIFCSRDNFIAGGHANSKKEEEQFLKLMKKHKNPPKFSSPKSFDGVNLEL